MATKTKKKKKHNPLAGTANTLVRCLKEKGYTVQRYDAASGSIYLKLDFGVCYSIRIGDHHGKPHLKYRFNIGPHIPNEAIANDDGFVRYFFPMHDMHRVMRAINRERANKIEKYGEYAYKKFLKLNREQNQGKLGLWQSARLV